MAIEMEGTTIAAGVVSILSGFMVNFIGLRLNRPTMLLSGFFWGFWIAYLIVNSINSDFGDNERWIIFGICMGSAFFVALISVLVKFIGIFLVGGIAGLLLVAWSLVFVDSYNVVRITYYRWILLGGIAFASGLLTISFRKPLFIVSSSIMGAFFLFYGFDSFANIGFIGLVKDILQANQSQPLETNSYIFLAMLMVSAIIGMIVQALTTKSIELENVKERQYYTRINS